MDILLTTRTCSNQLAGTLAVPVWGDGDVLAEDGRVQVLHEPQGHAPRGEAGRVDPAARGVVGAPTCSEEQRGRVGRQDVGVVARVRWMSVWLIRVWFCREPLENFPPRKLDPNIQTPRTIG